MLGNDDIEILIDQPVTAEDLFGEDEAEVIPPLSPLNENANGDAVEGDEAGTAGDDAATAAVAKKEKRRIDRLPNLNEKWLTDPKREGIPQVNKYFEKMKFKKEKGNELTNFKKILKRYEYWAQQCYPKYCFTDVVNYVELLSGKRMIKFALQGIRNKTEPLNDDDMDIDNDADDNPGNQGNTDNTGVFPNVQTPFNTPIDPIISSQPNPSQPVTSPSMTNELREIIRRKREEAIAKRKQKLDESLNSSNISTSQSKGENEANISFSQSNKDVSDVIAGDISDAITDETSSAVNVAHTSEVVNHVIENDSDIDSDNDELKISEEPMIQHIGENIMNSLFEDDDPMETEDQKLSDEDDLPDFNVKVINSITEKDTNAEIGNGQEKTDEFTIQNLDEGMQDSVTEKEFLTKQNELKISDENLNKNTFEESSITEKEDIMDNNEDKLSNKLPSHQEEVVEYNKEEISHQQEVVESNKDEISLIQDRVEEMDNFITEKEDIVGSSKLKISDEHLMENSESMNNSVTESTEHEVSHEPPCQKEDIVECNEHKISVEHLIENSVEEIGKIIIENEEIVENSEHKISDDHLIQNCVEEVVNFVIEKENTVKSNERKICDEPRSLEE